MLLAPSVVAYSRTGWLRSLRAHSSQLRRTSLFGNRQNSLSSFDVSQFWAGREFCVVGLHASAKQTARGKRVVSLVERERKKKKIQGLSGTVYCIHLAFLLRRFLVHYLLIKLYIDSVISSSIDFRSAFDRPPCSDKLSCTPILHVSVLADRT